MWIKTGDGLLVNCDRAAFITYIPGLNETQVYADGRKCTISDGDVTDQVAMALRCGTTVLEVGKRG
jgi:hypothetical protein